MAALLDPLYCHEEQQSWDAEDDADLLRLQSLPLSSGSEEWAEILSALSAKELETHPGIPDGSPQCNEPYLSSMRRGAVEWVVRACARHAFSAPTAVLAVSYLDRCFLGGELRPPDADCPWMERLSAVACLSLAAKMEETHVPLLLDLQAEAVVGVEEAVRGGGRLYLFEAKTVRRMELLVLSALGWRMNSVTPLSFIEHVLPKVVGVDAGATAGSGNARLQEVVRRCHAILLSVVADRRWVQYPPSVWAGAIVLHAMGQPLESCELTEHVLALLSLTKERVQSCYQLIISGSAGGGSGNKRKHWSPVWIPNGVVGSCFNCVCNWTDSDSRTVGPLPAFSLLRCCHYCRP